MPKNTPLPMQWLTVDGQNVPIVLPDHWDDDKKEWKTTGTGNPLPIANYTQNASGVWLPTSESNPMPTQVTGRNVEEIRDYSLTVDKAGNHNAGDVFARGANTVLNVEEFKDISVVIRNTGTIATSTGAIQLFTKNGSTSFQSTGNIMIDSFEINSIPAGATRTITAKDFPRMSDSFKGLFLFNVLDSLNQSAKIVILGRKR